MEVKGLQDFPSGDKFILIGEDAAFMSFPDFLHQLDNPFRIIGDNERSDNVVEFRRCSLRVVWHIDCLDGSDFVGLDVNCYFDCAFHSFCDRV